MKQTYPPKWGKNTLKALEEITRFGYSMSDVFSDFVDIFLAVILSRTENLKYSKAEVEERFSKGQLTGPYEERYLQIVGRYKENKTRKRGERPADFFAEACNYLQMETQALVEDVIGDIYEFPDLLWRAWAVFHAARHSKDVS